MAFAASEAEPQAISLLGWVRVSWRIAAMLLLLLVCVPLFYLWKLVRLHNPWPRIFLAGVGWLAGMRVRVVGTPVMRHVLYSANHVSWLDIPLLAGVSGAAFVAHDGLAAHPGLRRLCEMNETIFVARGDRMSVADQAGELRAALGRGRPVALFPEGTTSNGHSLLPFKSSLFSVLEPPPPGLCVQPVLIDFGDSTDEVAWIGTEPGLTNALRVLARHHTLPVDVHFLAAFHPADMDGRKAIAAHIRNALEDRLIAARRSRGFQSGIPIRQGRG